MAQFSLMLAGAIDEAILRHADEKRPQLSGIGEAPAPLSKAIQNVHPDRLDDVNGVELGAQIPRELAAHHHAQIRLVGKKGPFDGRLIAAVQLLQ